MTGAVNDVERRTINVLHFTHSAQTLTAWIEGPGIPEEVIRTAIATVCPERSPLWAEFYADIQQGVMFDPPEQLRGKKSARLTPEQTGTLLVAHWLRCLRRYEEALGVAWTPGLLLSENALRLYGLMVQDYLRSGWIHSGGLGSIHGTLQLGRLSETAVQEAFRELTQHGFVQPSGPFTYALLTSVRVQLFEHFNLLDQWSESAHQMARAGAIWAIARLEEELAIIRRGAN